MFRGLIGPLALLLLGPAAAVAQSPLPPPATPASSFPPGLPVPALPPDEVPRPPEPTGLLGPAFFQEASAYPYLWWLRADVLIWRVKHAPAPPPLATTGPSTDLSPAVLGQPGTRVVLGGQPIEYGTSVGGRWTVGTWCDPCQNSGLEFTGLLVDPPPQTPAVVSNASGVPILGRPFFAVPSGGPSVDYAAFPNRFAGAIGFAAHSRLWGLETLYVHNLVPWTEYGRGGPFSGVYRVDWLAGVRYLDLGEDLNVGQQSNILAGGVANFQGATVLAPNSILVADRFQTRNMFWAGEMGARAEVVCGNWFLNCTGKLALGGTRETVNISGASTLLQPPAAGVPPGVVTGGLLATATNIGRRSHDVFTVVPEMGINVGFQIFQQVRFYAGYTFLYWSSVVRPGSQIDPVVNVTQVPIHPSFNSGPLVGPAQPVPLFRTTDFWAQGVNLGLELHF